MDVMSIVQGAAIVLAVIGALLLVGFLLSRVVLRRNFQRAKAALPPSSPGDYEESAVGLTAPYKAYGLLRLTTGDLIFASGTSGDTLTVPRSAIAACVASEDVPTGSGMQTLRSRALVVQVNDPALPQGVAFMVTDPAAWVTRLRSS